MTKVWLEKATLEDKIICPKCDGKMKEFSELVNRSSCIRGLRCAECHFETIEE